MSLSRTVAAATLLFTACGEVDGASPDAAEPADAPPDVDAPPDGPPDATPPRCDPAAPFQAPQPLAELNGAASEESAFLSPDEQRLYFSSTRAGTMGGYDLFVASRDGRDGPFGDVTPIAGVNSTGHDRTPTVTGDGLQLYATIGASPNVDVATATRNGDGTFPALAAVAAVNSNVNDEISAVLPDHRAVYLHSNREGNYQLYRSQRSGGVLLAPLPLSGTDLNTAAHEAGAAISPDELHLYFASDRAGGAGGFDIYEASRTSTADGFGAPVNLAVLNTAEPEWPSWISPDGCQLYVTRGTGSYDLYVATRGM
jgi:Tol biopolymer transport system component